ncbi:MAG: hypothetical protein LAT68_14765 [Cyclobacteriaceae bacterium]|nr:hypothetical protein [Cyclobacteriaceae bacterium]MCH8517582.1 hypothetical protein [Cyclobacteriaceae bacterium]
MVRFALIFMFFLFYWDANAQRVSLINTVTEKQINFKVGDRYSFLLENSEFRTFSVDGKIAMVTDSSFLFEDAEVMFDRIIGYKKKGAAYRARNIMVATAAIGGLVMVSLTPVFIVAEVFGSIAADIIVPLVGGMTGMTWGMFAWIKSYDYRKIEGPHWQWRLDNNKNAPDKDERLLSPKDSIPADEYFFKDNY